jgi:predicted N-acetyltransferase YhbS
VIGVDPARQGLGLGTALIEHGLGVARDQRLPAFLETANPRNVAYYERFGFRVVEDGHVPGGGSRFWFMRFDPGGALTSDESL